MSKQVATLEGQQITEGRPADRYESFRNSITSQKEKIERVLPAHISFEKFQSVVMTACMTDPNLLHAHRPSLLLSCVKSATDGLLPDGRDAALVIFNAKIGKDEGGRDVWGKKVQYMPMYAGVLKKVRQSQELSSINTQVVYTNDKFHHRLGDADEIVHEIVDGNDRGEFKAVYCIAKLKDGSVMKEVMYKQDIEKVRRTSKSGNDDKGNPKGIWKDWYDEMAKKTVFRRLAKWLPQSTDKGDVLRVFDNDESMEIIDHAEEDATYSIEGQATDQIEDQTPPEADLKKAITDKKEASNPVEKEEAPPKHPVEEGGTLERTPLDIEREIRAAVGKAETYQEAYDLVSGEFAEDLDYIKEKASGAHATLKAWIDGQLKKLGE